MADYLDDVVVKDSAISGKGLFTTRAIESAGSLILGKARGLVAVATTRQLGETCANCFAWTHVLGSTVQAPPEPRKFNACGGCRVPRYCGKKCQSQAWKRYHKHECQILKSLKPNMQAAVVRVITQLISMRQLQMVSDEDWTAVKSMASNCESYEENHKENEWLVNGLSMLAPTFKAGLDEANETAGLTVKDLLCRISTNCLTLVNPTFDDLGIVFDPLAAAANHSCEPNAFVVMDGAEFSFRSLRPLRKGEEVLISYIDDTMPWSIRQWDLKERYGFACGCPKCARGPGPHHREDLFYKLDEMSQEYKDFADKTLKEIEAGKAPDIEEKYRVKQQSELDSKRAAIVQQVAFIRLERAAEAKASEQLKIVMWAMRDVGASNIFPFTRQPAALIWNEVILMNIKAKKHTEAWIQGVKRHCEIDPVLYPFSGHPLRVVHAWTLLRHTIFLFTEHSQETQMFIAKMQEDYQVDFTIVVFNLIADLKDNVQKSHGAASTFGKAVLQEYEDISQQFVMRLGSKAALTQHRKIWPKMYENWRNIGKLLEI